MKVKHFKRRLSRKTVNMTRWEFEAEIICGEKSKTYRGFIIENYAMNMHSIYRKRNSKSGIVFCSSPSASFKNTKVGTEIYLAFKDGK